MARAGLAKDTAVSAHHLTLIHYLFAALLADGAPVGLAENGGQWLPQRNGLDGYQQRIGDALVAQQVFVPAAGLVGGKLLGQMARNGRWRNTHRRSGVGIYQGGGHLAVIGDAQGAPPDKTVGGHSNPVRTAAVGFHDGEQPFVIIVERGGGRRVDQVQRQQAAQPQAHPEHLARAQVVVSGCRAGQQCG